MKKILVLLGFALLLFAVAACDDVPAKPANTSSSDSSAAGDDDVGEESSATASDTPETPTLQKIAPEAFEGYSTAEYLPTKEELAHYLQRAMAANGAAPGGEYELWQLDKGEGTREIRLVQLLVYPAGGSETAEPEYWGVDRNNGTVYRWNASAQQAPEPMPTPEVFPTPLSAIEYIKAKFRNPKSSFILELQPADPNGEYGEQYPHYRSQTIFGEGERSFTYVIDMEVREDSYIVHSYEIVMDSPDEGHTATTSWHRVYPNGFIVDEMLGSVWIGEG